MQRTAEYLSAWRLGLSTAKTTCTAFHLNNRESSRRLAVTINGATIPCIQTPTYLGVPLDRQLTFKQRFKSLCGKVRARNCLLRLLAGSTWGANASVLRTSALGLVYSAAEHAAPAWCRSTHTKKARCCVKRYVAQHLWVPETDPQGVFACALGHFTGPPAQRTFHIQAGSPGTTKH